MTTFFYLVWFLRYRRLNYKFIKNLRNFSFQIILDSSKTNKNFLRKKCLLKEHVLVKSFSHHVKGKSDWIRKKRRKMKVRKGIDLLFFHSFSHLFLCTLSQFNTISLFFTDERIYQVLSSLLSLKLQKNFADNEKEEDT